MPPPPSVTSACNGPGHCRSLASCSLSRAGRFYFEEFGIGTMASSLSPRASRRWHAWLPGPAGRQVLLSSEEGRSGRVGQRGDRLCADLRQQRGEVLGIALARAGREARAGQEALHCGAEARDQGEVGRLTSLILFTLAAEVRSAPGRGRTGPAPGHPAGVSDSQAAPARA